MWLETNNGFINYGKCLAIEFIDERKEIYFFNNFPLDKGNATYIKFETQEVYQNRKSEIQSKLEREGK